MLTDHEVHTKLGDAAKLLSAQGVRFFALRARGVRDRKLAELLINSAGDGTLGEIIPEALRAEHAPAFMFNGQKQVLLTPIAAAIIALGRPPHCTRNGLMQETSRSFESAEQVNAHFAFAKAVDPSWTNSSEPKVKERKPATSVARQRVGGNNTASIQQQLAAAAKTNAESAAQMIQLLESAGWEVPEELRDAAKTQDQPLNMIATVTAISDGIGDNASDSAGSDSATPLEPTLEAASSADSDSASADSDSAGSDSASADSDSDSASADSDSDSDSDSASADSDSDSDSDSASADSDSDSASADSDSASADSDSADSADSDSDSADSAAPAADTSPAPVAPTVQKPTSKQRRHGRR